MKKILYTALLLLSAGCLFTSCGDDDGDVAISKTPAKDVAGIYNGTWTVTTEGQDPNVCEGTLELTELSTYAMTLTTSIPSISGEEQNSTSVNITGTTNGYFFSSTVVDASINPFGGKTISGRIDGDKVTFVYTKEVKVGRKNVGYVYSFEGTKESVTSPEQGDENNVPSE